MANSEINNWAADIQTLLGQSKVCFLATQGQNGPETSMAPYAIHNATILLHLSKLARHTANIETNSSIGLMICTPEPAADSPLALPRLSLQGEATSVSDKQLDAARQAYLNAIPDAEPLFSFADFRLFQFTPSRIHWVGGFGSARKIAVSDWCALFAENEGEMP
jgi:putative heme iron utilization protein